MTRRLSKWAFAQSLRFVPKGQMLSTQTDGTNQVLKMEAVCVVELLNAAAIAVSCCDWLCYLFKLFFPRRLLEDYFVVLIDTFKLSIAIILTLCFLSCHNIFHQNYIDFFLWKIILIVTESFYFCQKKKAIKTLAHLSQSDTMHLKYFCNNKYHTDICIQ